MLCRYSCNKFNNISTFQKSIQRIYIAQNTFSISIQSNLKYEKDRRYSIQFKSRKIRQYVQRLQAEYSQSIDLNRLAQIQKEMTELKSERDESYNKGAASQAKLQNLEKIVDQLQLTIQSLIQANSEKTASAIMKEKQDLEGQIVQLQEKTDNYNLLASKLDQLIARLQDELHQQKSTQSTASYPKNFQQDDTYKKSGQKSQATPSSISQEASIQRQFNGGSGIYSQSERENKLQPITEYETSVTQSQQLYQSIWWDMGIESINDSKSSLYALLNSYKSFDYKEQAFSILNLLNLKTDILLTQQLSFANLVALLSLLSDQFQLASKGASIETSFGSTFLKFLPSVTIQSLYKKAVQNCVQQLDGSNKSADNSYNGVTKQITIKSVPSILVTLAKFVDIPRNKAEDIVTQNITGPFKDKILQALVMLRSDIKQEEISRQVDPILAILLQLISVLDPNINNEAFKNASKDVQPIVSYQSRTYIYQYMKIKGAQPHVLEIFREFLEGSG